MVSQLLYVWLGAGRHAAWHSCVAPRCLPAPAACCLPHTACLRWTPNTLQHSNIPAAVGHPCLAAARATLGPLPASVTFSPCTVMLSRSLQEWVIHAWLLHAPFDWVGTRIHVGHHQRPYFHVGAASWGLRCECWLDGMLVGCDRFPCFHVGHHQRPYFHVGARCWAWFKRALLHPGGDIGRL